MALLFAINLIQTEIQIFLIHSLNLGLILTITKFLKHGLLSKTTTVLPKFGEIVQKSES